MSDGCSSDLDRAGLAAAVAQLGAVLRRARHRQSCDVRDDPGETDEFRPLVDDQSLGRHRPLLPLHAEPGAGDAEEWTGGFRGSGRRQKMRSEEHTSELQSLMRISYAVFCLNKKNSIYSAHTK